MGGRKYDFGIDQILHVEMVLPSSLHIKFGPAEREDATASEDQHDVLLPKDYIVQ